MVSSRRMSIFAVLIALGAIIAPSGSGQSTSLPVVPGAFGFGMQTRAAYGCGASPTVHRVTSLADSGAGTLRAALQASGPRVVIFETSGYIDLTSQINVDSPCLTVAGQTAPSPGITVRMVGTFANTAMILVWTHDTLWQHLRIRPGSTTCNSGIQFYDGGSGLTLYNNILDHMSVSWAQDEGIAFTDNAHDSTIWRSLVGEMFAFTPGTDACTGGGTTEGNGLGVGFGDNIAILQSLSKHNRTRNPQIGGGGSTYIANNLIYGSGIGPLWADVTNVGAFLGSAIGNHMRRDSNTDEGLYPAFMSSQAVTGSRLYLSDNIFDNGSNPEPFVEFHLASGIDPRVGTPPITIPGYTPMPSSAVYDFVLANSGARPLDRDPVDVQFVQDVRNRSGSFKNDIGQTTGYPTLAVIRRTLTLPADPHATTASGYTNLEVWLHGYAAALEGAASAPSAPAAPSNLRIVSN